MGIVFLPADQTIYPQFSVFTYFFTLLPVSLQRENATHQSSQLFKAFLFIALYIIAALTLFIY